MESSDQIGSSEIPFLVTNWLSRFQSNNDETNDDIKAKAMDKIRQATNDLAKAFSELGAFGKTVIPSLDSDNQQSNMPMHQLTSFEEAKRNMSCPPDQLELLVEASLATSQAVSHSRPRESSSIILRAAEVVVEKRKEDGGHTLSEAISVDEDRIVSDGDRTVSQTTTMQKPFLLGNSNDASIKVGASGVEEETKRAAEATSEFLRTKQVLYDQQRKLRTLQLSIENHESALADLRVNLSESQTQQLSGSSHAAPVEVARWDQLKEDESNRTRVLAQLKRQVLSTQQEIEQNEALFGVRQLDTVSKFRSLQRARLGFQLPSTAKVNLAQFIGQLRSGGLHFPLRRYQRGNTKLKAVMKSLRHKRIESNLSHAVTINTHLSYPVYCLRFDRSGRYFITGADDYLVRVFCLGEYVHLSHQRRVSIGHESSPIDGAVLVCTLRGHAGVINNIDVSLDNSFLASASEDGDVRVWGLSDGSPIANLRGHGGGANTVSWSATSPYRLTTASGDGLARHWDIKGACQKRYGKVIGARAECDDIDEVDASVEDRTEALQPEPPLLPPLPEGQGILQQAANGQPHQANDATEGRFVANAALDEGVTLLQQLHHGVNQPATDAESRNREHTVKVLCVARCPHGGHFATGSDDGICRVWREQFDDVTYRIDSKESDWEAIIASGRPQYRLFEGSSGTPFLSLKGNSSAITDLSYSHSGHRILSASQKDGAIRIWSFCVDPTLLSTHKPSHIAIKLANPDNPEKSTDTEATARRPKRGGPRCISCDVAIWSRDDKYIITSQSELEKENGTDIVIGSQYIFLWDSLSGCCLLGIPAAHTMQCPVLVQHPFDMSILCSAGADGYLKVWNLEKGSLVYSHRNVLEHGPVDPRDLGKPCGYLDGAFSPSGDSLVLSDDCGRVSLFSSVNCDESERFFWMKEQYFANDYYDLCYDENGYCIERGSEMPPHIAPRGVRCSHAGIAYSEKVNDDYKFLIGPVPSAETEARASRQYRRALARKALDRRPESGTIRVGQYDPKTTTFLRHPESKEEDKRSSILRERRTGGSPRRSPPRQSVDMSSNYRWRDYNDMMREEAEMEFHYDSDDEDFQVVDRGRTLNGNLSSDSEDDAMDDVVFEDDELAVDAGDRRQTQRRVSQLLDSESEEELVEWMSTNNVPTGAFVTDYDIHFFRVSDSRSDSIEREWVRRLESNSSYGGRKNYTPQVDDDIIYVPRAHKDTIAHFPTFEAPWDSWPDHSNWPVVRCLIRHVRYRFPFKAYFGRSSSSQQRSCSVVAILTLEITGIPRLPQDRSFAWPSVEFDAPEEKIMFELSLFENSEADFVVPLGLYLSRLRKLEEALSSQESVLQMEAYYRESRREDAELTPYRGVIESAARSSDLDGDPHLACSGYRSVSVVWDTGERDLLSPWEVSLTKFPAESKRTMLNSAQKTIVRRCCQTLREIEGVEDLFGSPVDEHLYTDYKSRIEVPMDFTVVSARLEADFYGSLRSLLFDIELMKDNCVKYNGDNHDASVVAHAMVESAIELLLSREEIRDFKEFRKSVEERARTRPRRPVALVLNRLEPEPAQAAAPAIRRSGRERRPPNQSSLESLPEPSRGRSTRRTRSTRERDNPAYLLRRTRRSVLERNPMESRGTLESLSSSRGRSRGRRNLGSPSTHRSLRMSTLQAVGVDRRSSLRTNSGRGRGNVRISYADQPSDAEQENEDGSNGPEDSDRGIIERQRESRAERMQRRESRESTDGERRIRSSRIGDDMSSTSANLRQNSRRRIASRHVISYSSADEVQADEMSFNNEMEDDESSEDEVMSTLESDDSSPLRMNSRTRRHESASNTSAEDYNVNRRETRTSQASVDDLSSDNDVPRETRSARRRPSAGSRTAGKGRSTRKSGTRESIDDSSDDGDKDTRRQTRRSRVASHTSLEVPDEDTTVRADLKRKRSPRTSTRLSDDRATSKPAQSESESESESEAVTSDGMSGLSIQKRSKRVSTYEDPSSDDLPSDDSDVEPKRRMTQYRNNSRHSSSHEETASEQTTSPRKRSSRVQLNYEIPSSDDLPSEESDREDRRRVKVPRKNAAGNRNRGHPIPESWPDIDVKSISRVTHSILERLRLVDEGSVFEEPVAETYPELATAYTKVIEEPMDFRTIEEDRLPRYRSIQELQQDLMLVFNNCMAFSNDASDELSILASEMLGMLRDIFTSVCEEHDVLLTRRWK